MISSDEKAALLQLIHDYGEAQARWGNRHGRGAGRQARAERKEARAILHRIGEALDRVTYEPERSP